MKNSNYLFSKNTVIKWKPHIENGKIVVSIHAREDQLFSGREIYQLIGKVNFLIKKWGNAKIPITIDLGNANFIDKLTFVILESICYSLIVEYSIPVQIYMNVKGNIATYESRFSPMKLLNGTNIDEIKKYKIEFDNNIYLTHYRKVVDGVGKESTNYLGDVQQEIDSFLKNLEIKEALRNEIALVVTELVGNSCEHAETDCLVDIDVTPDTNTESAQVYYGINIVVINFSLKLLGDDIKKNILDKKKAELSERYQKVIDAYELHSCYFDQHRYYEEDFRNITAFQTRISGRDNCFKTGGTGLTKLIEALETESEAYRCYVISGKRCINFYKDMLRYNKNGWIGFNQQNDYLNYIPYIEDDNKNEGARSVVGDDLIYMPGTAYNLNFVMKGGNYVGKQ